MLGRQFLLEYPLYRKFEFEWNGKFDKLPMPSIHMRCTICRSDQTFNCVAQYLMKVGKAASLSPKGEVVCVLYRCASCNNFLRHFILKFGRGNENYVMKVGQEPPWDISIDRDLEQALGEEYALYYKRGLTCESQSYGIGAFGYYRRIVEEIIDYLLDSIEGFLSGAERDEYAKALKKAKKTTRAQDKIAIVKELLPPTLRPGNMNPLSTLHEVLSEGLHTESDERCMELAVEVREALVFLTSRIASEQKASDRYTTAMRKLQARSKRKSNTDETEPNT